MVGETVVFRVVKGAGLVAPGSIDEGRAVIATTDAQGMASAQFKVGFRSGVGNHAVRAQVVGFDDEIIFYAHAQNAPGNKITVNSGNNQRSAAHRPLPAPFIVAVVDEGANLVQGARVEFKVLKGGGHFENDAPTIIATTDSDGRATAHLTLGALEGLDVQRVTATLLDVAPSVPVGEVVSSGFTASALVIGAPGATTITGVVFDNQDNPLPGVTVRVEGTTRQAVVDANGQFTITQAPIGPVHLIADGSTTTVAGEYPSLSYNLVTISGAENPLSAPIYMVKLNQQNAKYAGLEDVEVTLDEVPGFKFEVPAGSVTFPDGSKEGWISVTAVNSSKVPMAPPNGMQPQLIVTIQPTGAMFDPPAPLTLPNVDGRLPGAQVEMYSYDHDLEEFVTIGLGTVSRDGTLIESNTGVGVIKAGWHCGSQPTGSGGAGSPPPDICEGVEPMTQDPCIFNQIASFGPYEYELIADDIPIAKISIPQISIFAIVIADQEYACCRATEGTMEYRAEGEGKLRVTTDKGMTIPIPTPLKVVEKVCEGLKVKLGDSISCALTMEIVTKGMSVAGILKVEEDHCKEQPINWGGNGSISFLEPSVTGGASVTFLGKLSGYQLKEMRHFMQVVKRLAQHLIQLLHLEMYMYNYVHLFRLLV